MITPARWMTATSGSLVEFRRGMITDNRICKLFDYSDASYCFPSVEIKGGVCYFLWNNGHTGNCDITTTSVDGITTVNNRALSIDGVNTIVRDGRKISILQKTMSLNEDSFSSIVSTNDPFGFDLREAHSSRRVKPVFSTERADGDIPLYYNGWRKDGIGYVSSESVRKGTEMISAVKVFIPKAWGTGTMEKDWINPFIPEDNAVCTETYLVVGPFESRIEAENVISYMQTRFFHMMVSIVKSTQNTMQKAYTYVPMQDFSKSWTDEMLYEKYGLSEEEISIIERIKPME